LEALQINVPPFNYQLNHIEMLQNVRRQMDQLAQAAPGLELHDAADQYRRLILAEPNDWVLEKRLAETLQKSGDLNGAAECWQRIRELVPQNAQAALQLDLIFMEQGKLELAADEYAKALKLDRNYTENAYAKFLYNMGESILQKSGGAAAVPFFRQAIDLRPHFAEAHIGLGFALSAMGKTSEAQQEFRDAIHYPPTTPLGLESLGKACYQEGWTNEAIRNFEAALELDPTDSTAHFHLGVLFFEQQKNTAALNEFKETLRFDPENKEASAYLAQFPKSHTGEP
jgi:tetratricopeptide (TPR) repeat protein